jgi:hypothetical protein
MPNLEGRRNESLRQTIMRSAEVDEINAQAHRENGDHQYAAALERSAQRQHERLEHYRKHGLPWKGM